MIVSAEEYVERTCRESVDLCSGLHFGKYAAICDLTETQRESTRQPLSQK